MELLNFDYWKVQGSWELLPTISVYSGRYYNANSIRTYKTISLVVGFLRFRAKWLWLTRSEYNG